MMIHEKVIAEQFSLDFNNEHKNILHPTSSQHAAHLSHRPFHPLQPQAYGASHLLPYHALQHQTHVALPSSSVKQLDIYSAFAYKQHQQQQALIGGYSPTKRTGQHQSTSEVLDLSRRDSVETTRKTPSPQNTNSSFGDDSCAGSPTHSQQKPMIPSNLLYSTQQQFNHLTPPFASFYPALYSSFGQPDKEGTVTTSQILTAVTPSITTAPSLLAAQTPISNNCLAVASVVAAAAAAVGTPSSTLHSIKSEEEHMTAVSPVSSLEGRSKSPVAQINSASSSSSAALNSLKSTRPFKAFPRDPLVIAANFAANDVLLDNPRVERYTEYRKRVLEQIRNSNGGSRTVTNPKMRRMNSRRTSNTSSNAPECGSSEGEERHGGGVDESSDCDSSYTGGQAEKVSSSANAINESNNNNQASEKKCGTNNNNSNSTSGQIKDANYYERRRKNNAAAKKSRDRRRIKEDEIAIRAAYLERQNIELLCQIDALKAQLAAFTSKMVNV
ncbi:protein giant [Anastrepha obliqua]|uniref:protein giant n=1 Tax=Anastrepha obliqua TaxID=95512 RepID=UPI0024095266|nr:protein giant [Anastrepha obliqua]